MIVQRARLGQLVVAVGSATVVAALCVIGAATLATSTSTVSDAAPDLLQITEVRRSVVDELVVAIPRLYPPGAISGETASAVVERMLRDGGFIEGTRVAAADAHRVWLDGGAPAPTLGPDVLGPAALAALRDVDIELAREFPDPAAIGTVTVSVPVKTTAATVTAARSTAVALLVIGLVGIAVGAVLDHRGDRVLRRVSDALFVFAAIGGAAALLLPIPDLSSRAWWLPTMAALSGVSRTSILLVAGGALLLAAFLRATSSQIAPLVDDRDRRRDRAAEGPLPASSGRQLSRRRGRAVRQQAIDAFFDEDADADERSDAGPAVLEDGDDRPAGAYRGDGFDQAIAAVEADRQTAPPAEADDAADDDGAAERREALERIDGKRSRLRTHLPR